MKSLKKTGTAAAVCLCLLLTAGLLWGFLRSTGSDTAAASESVSAAIMSKFGMFVNNSSADALSDITPIKKVYTLPEDLVVAPEPDQSLFGTAASPAELESVIASAAELMDGQETLFGSDIELMPGSSVDYYLDDTILAITWKQAIKSACYTFSEIKIADASQFRRYLADNTFGSGIQYRPSDMASTVNAVVGMSGDFYKFRPMGIVVYQRNLYRTSEEALDTCLINSAGDLIFLDRSEVRALESVEDYVWDNDILFSLAFGPILVENGENVCPDQYPIGEIHDTYSRAAIAQLGELHYLLVTINYEGPYVAASTVRELAKTLTDMGCPKAYTLDGGQTGTIIMNDTVINNVDYGEQRNISDIIYFATALPD